MMLAQQLYEAGYISYMRTDSVNLSQDSLTAAKNFIDSSFGKIIPWANPADSKAKPKGRKKPTKPSGRRFPQERPTQ